jgi:SAM-dependent methyltransferase
MDFARAGDGLGQALKHQDSRRNGLEVFAVSALVLFLELACIRWFPAHVLLLTFFTNSVLLACFLGMSIGCLVAKHEHNYLTWTTPILLVGILAAHGAELVPRLERMVDVGDNTQVVYFGAEKYSDIAHFVVPMEVLCGFFFIVICLAMVGPGQELGRSLARVPHRVQAYTINIAGSLAGIVAFSLGSYLELSPPYWFTVIAVAIAWYLTRESPPAGGFAWVKLVAPLAALVILASWRSGSFGFDRTVPGTTYWSPYYRIDYENAPRRNISVNLIGHQRMEPLDRYHEYAFPHMLRRDVQRLEHQPEKPFDDVLVIGAGSGNDVSRALRWNVGHVDAVEIDPVIIRLGRRDHPAQPYSDPRVSLHNDDGRNFIRSSDKSYDLIVYALVDSLVLHSSFSNIRLESYLFTKEAFDDVRRHLKPNGIFATYNYFRQGWVVSRLEKTLRASFGTDPIVIMLPYRDSVEPDATFGAFTILLSGSEEALAPIRKAYAANGTYWLDKQNVAPESKTNGFLEGPPPSVTQDDDRWTRFGLAQVIQPADDLPLATDDWPFLYMRKPMVPNLSLRAAAIMAALGLALLYLFDRSKTAGRSKRGGYDATMFFLGAGFMLVETKAVVRMALLFGSTWIVNSIVFFAVLVLILLANLYVLRFQPRTLWAAFIGLLVTLLLTVFVPLDALLGLSRVEQILLSSALVAAPIFFAGIVFATRFAKVKEPDRAFGANIAGAMLGGLAEYSSMRLGFQYVGFVAIGFYLLALLSLKLQDQAEARQRGDRAFRREATPSRERV